MRPYSLALPLAPVLILQGSRVRKNIIELPEASGPRQGLCGQGPALKLLVLGDSAAAGVGVDKQQKALAGCLSDQLGQHFQLSWQLHAKSGNTTEQTLDMLFQLPAQKFDVVVISTGVNDVTSKTPLARWLSQLQQIQFMLNQKFRADHVFYAALPPMGRFPSLPHPLRFYLGRRARLFDRHLRRFVNGVGNARHVAFEGDIDEAGIAEDGFHPSGVAYKAWADQVVQGYLKEVEQNKRAS